MRIKSQIPNPKSHLLRGNVMLISLLILLAILLGFSIIGMTLSVGEQQADTVALNKTIARQATTACIETAVNKLARDPDYAGNETIAVSTSTSCLIRPVTSSTTWIIESEATVGNENSRERAVLSSRLPVVIQSWIEVASF